MVQDKLRIIAATAFGMEAVCKREMQKLGYTDLFVENGRIEINGTFKDVVRLNLWLRTAERIKIKVGTFKAETFTELFDETKKIQWGKIIPKGGAFPVDAKSVKSKLFSLSDCQKIVKKAIVEKLKEERKEDWLDESGVLYRFEVSLLNDIAEITLDTSGAGLHKRGYRKLIGFAPIKETMAAAMIDLSYWNKDRILLDPMCGSGTFPIEAALIARNIAPGLNRKFTAEKWENFDLSLWQKEKTAAKKLIDYDTELNLYGYDYDPEVVEIAKINADDAGVLEDVHFESKDFLKLDKLPWEYGVMITNPPYGERIDKRDEAIQIYKKFGQIMEENPTWSYYLLTSNEDFEGAAGKKSDRKRKLFNGNIKVDYYQYYGPRPPKE
jgi:putative N6-adenine-specific DNA methylase